MNQHSSPFEQRTTPVDILRPANDTCPVSSDSESEGILVFLEDDTSSSSSTVPAPVQRMLQPSTSSAEVPEPDSSVAHMEGIFVFLHFFFFVGQLFYFLDPAWFTLSY